MPTSTGVWSKETSFTSVLPLAPPNLISLKCWEFSAGRMSPHTPTPSLSKSAMSLYSSAFSSSPTTSSSSSISDRSRFIPSTSQPWQTSMPHYINQLPEPVPPSLVSTPSPPLQSPPLSKKSELTLQSQWPAYSWNLSATQPQHLHSGPFLMCPFWLENATPAPSQRRWPRSRMWG